MGCVGMQTYRKRVFDKILQNRLEAKGAVLIEGTKWCGKTTTAEQIARSVVYMQNPATRDQNAQLARIAPQRLLEGDVPHLIDEWQVAPQLWDAVRFEVDQRDEFGQLILTGSSVPASLDEAQHSGTGRIARMTMRPMTLGESGDSSCAVSMGALFKGEKLRVERSSGSDIEELAYLVCRGGWPKAVDQQKRDVALKQAFDYVDAVCEVDISRVDGVRRDPYLTRALLRSYARSVSSETTLGAMRADLGESGAYLGESAFGGYVEALRKLFVIDDLSAWNPNLRSKTAIRTSPTRHFADPSIATAALGAGPEDLIGDLRTFGLVFEDLVVRDLRTYAEALHGTVLHYRDKSGLECDAVVHLRNGAYGLIEVKLGGADAIEEGAKNLLKLSQRIDVDTMRAPAFLMVVTGTGEFSYPREDGVYVVPIRALTV